MAKMTKAKLRSTGIEIMSMAKKIRAKSPGKKWTTCVEEAGKAYEKKHK